MINVNPNLKNAITGTGTQLIRITGSCYDTSNVYHYISWTNSDVVQETFFVDKRCISGSQFSLGNTVSAELGFELFSAGFEDWLLEGVEVKVELGGYVSGVATYFVVGSFILDKPTQGTDRLILRGYDKLTKLDQLADNWIMKTGGGENILGDAIKIDASYPMNDMGYAGLVKGTTTAPYYTSSTDGVLTGLVPLSSNGRFPFKMIVDGMDITGADSYFILFYYNAGVLTEVSGLQWPLNYLATVTQIGTKRYEIAFTAGVDPNKTALQESIEYQYGDHDYFVTYTFSNGVYQTLTSLEVCYNTTTTATIEDTVNDVCNACGLTFLDTSPAAYNLTETYRPLSDYSKYTYRAVLGLFAEACGANLMLWPAGYGIFDNQVRFGTPDATGITLTEAEVLSCDLSSEPVILSGTRYVDADGALYINRVENTPPYKFLDFSSCPVFPINTQTAVNALAALTGSANAWLPGRAKILAMPWLEPMDVVSFSYSVKPYYSGKCLLTRVHITASGATQIESAGYNETSNSNGYIGAPYTNDANPDYDPVYSSAPSQAPGTSTDVALSTFTYNLPKVNDYVMADGGMGIVTAITGTFATVYWLANYTGSPQPHTHALQDVHAAAADKTAIATGDALIFTDADDGGKLKEMVDDFDTTNTTDFLRRDGTWAAPAGGVFKGVCTTGAGGSPKAVTAPGFTAADLVRGAVVFVTMNYGNTASVNTVEMSVNGTTAKPIRILTSGNVTPLSSADWVQYETYMFTYDGTYWVMSTDRDRMWCTTIGEGVWTSSDAGSTYRYMFLVSKKDKTIFPVCNVNSGSTNYTKAYKTLAFDPFGKYVYYNTTTTVAQNVELATNYNYFFTKISSMNANYCFNIQQNGTAGTKALAPHKPVYLRALYDFATQTATFDQDLSSSNYLERSSLVQDLPTTNPNSAGVFKIYIYLGDAITNDGRKMSLEEEHPVFAWNSATGKMELFTGAPFSGSGTFTLSAMSHTATWNYYKDGPVVKIWGPTGAWASETVTSLVDFTGLPFTPKFEVMADLPQNPTQNGNLDGYIGVRVKTDKTMNFMYLRLNNGGTLSLSSSLGYYMQYSTPYTMITYLTDE